MKNRETLILNTTEDLILVKRIQKFEQSQQHRFRIIRNCYK